MERRLSFPPYCMQSVQACWKLRHFRDPFMAQLLSPPWLFLQHPYYLQEVHSVLLVLSEAESAEAYPPSSPPSPSPVPTVMIWTPSSYIKILQTQENLSRVAWESHRLGGQNGELAYMPKPPLLPPWGCDSTPFEGEMWDYGWGTAGMNRCFNDVPETHISVWELMQHMNCSRNLV